jgi:hypothetical protein
MNHVITIAALLLTIPFDDVCITTVIAVEIIPVAKPEKVPPVTLTANVSKALPRSLRTLEIQLSIGEEFEIYSQHPHEYLPVFKLELLDAQLRPLRTRIQFPKAKTVLFDNQFGGDFKVYVGNPKFNASCLANKRPHYVRVFYGGYSTRFY